MITRRAMLAAGLGLATELAAPGAARSQALPQGNQPGRRGPSLREPLPAPRAPRSSRLPVFTGSVDHFDWVVAPTSRFIDLVAPPWPLHVAVFHVSDDQVRVDDPISGRPQGPAKLRQVLAKFRQHNPRAVVGAYLSGTAVGTREMIAERKSWPANLLEPQAALRKFLIIPPRAPACYATINLDLPDARRIWAELIVRELLARRREFGYQLGYLDEFAHPTADPRGFRWANTCDLLQQVRRRLHDEGMALGINVSLPLRGELREDLDLLLASVDFISIEGFASREVCSQQFFPQLVDNLRYLLRAGLAIGLIPITDPVENRRGRRVTQVSTAPEGGLRVVCDGPHWLADTATKTVRLAGVHAELEDLAFPATIVSDTAFDLASAPRVGTIRPGAAAKAWFLFSDSEPTAAMMLIAKSQAEERGYVLTSPGLELPWAEWPRTKGVRTSDYSIREVTDAGQVKLVTCDFPAERLFVDLQERHVWFEPLTARK